LSPRFTVLNTSTLRLCKIISCAPTVVDEQSPISSEPYWGTGPVGFFSPPFPSKKCQRYKFSCVVLERNRPFLRSDAVSLQVNRFPPSVSPRSGDERLKRCCGFSSFLPWFFLVFSPLWVLRVCRLVLSCGVDHDCCVIGCTCQRL